MSIRKESLSLLYTNNENEKIMKMLRMKSVIDKGIENHGIEKTYQIAIELGLELEIKYIKLKKIAIRDKAISLLGI